MDKPKNSDRIAEILEQEPTLTNTEVARRVGVARTYVHQVRNKLGCRPPIGARTGIRVQLAGLWYRLASGTATSCVRTT